MLDLELELDIRRRVNPAYADTIGTESYERKRLLMEIDRLREINTIYSADKIALCGKLNSGKRCRLPAGSKCPDCGPSAIDFEGD